MLRNVSLMVILIGCLGIFVDTASADPVMGVLRLDVYENGDVATITNTDTAPVLFDALQYLSPGNNLSDASFADGGWRSVQDWFAGGMGAMEVGGKLGFGALSFGDLIRVPNNLAEANLSGNAELQPGDSYHIGHPIAAGANWAGLSDDLDFTYGYTDAGGISTVYQGLLEVHTTGGGDTTAEVTVDPPSPTIPGPPVVLNAIPVGDTITIANIAPTGHDAATIDLVELLGNPHFSVSDITQGMSLPAGGLPASTVMGTVAFAKAGRLNGTHSATYNVTIADTLHPGGDDSGAHTWTLQAIVTGNRGGGSANVGPGGSYAGLGSTSDFASVIATPTVATLLAGSSSGGSQVITMDWREPGLWYEPPQPGLALDPPADVLEPEMLVSNVLDLDIVGYASEMFVLQMSYDQAAIDAHGDEATMAADGGIHIVYKPYEDPLDPLTPWIHAATLVPGVGDPLDTGPLGPWTSAYTTPGQWGVDIATNNAWVVLGGWVPGTVLPGEFAVVPEPGSMVLLLTGLLGLVFYLRRRR